MARLKILGRSYTIKKMSRKKSEKLWGTVEAETQVIEIDHRVHPQAIENTLLHEAIHVIEKEMGILLSEKKVRDLEMGISSFLRDNGVSLAPLRKK